MLPLRNRKPAPQKSPMPDMNSEKKIYLKKKKKIEKIRQLKDSTSAAFIVCKLDAG